MFFVFFLLCYFRCRCHYQLSFLFWFGGRDGMMGGVRFWCGVLCALDAHGERCGFGGLGGRTHARGERGGRAY